MKFTKMHGAGNDYIYLNCLDGMPSGIENLARRLSDRHYGIGGDGVICLTASKTADFQMRMFNADGSEGAMCGNGIRCLGKYIYEKNLLRRDTLTIETKAGTKQLKLELQAGDVARITVDMGVPKFGEKHEFSVNEIYYIGIEVSMGNPHFVICTTSLEPLNFTAVCSAVLSSPYFPDGVNIEFVQPCSKTQFLMRVWERGSGETLSCGTGACAAAAVLLQNCVGEHGMTAVLPGGELVVSKDAKGHIFLSGPAKIVFEGEISEEAFDDETQCKLPGDAGKLFVY